jgi:ribose-phosphate pyrophosphokinase
MHVVGEVRDRLCIIQDDIVDTAGTLQQASRALHDGGAARVLACAVHGVLSGPARERIDESVLEELIVTNTIPLRKEFAGSDKVRVLSVARLLGRAIQSIHQETSVSSLFV